MKKKHFILGLLLTVAGFGVYLSAQGRRGGGFGQGPGGPGRGGPGGGGPGNRETQELVKKFDTDENGWLDAEERAAAREETQSASNGSSGGFGPPGRGPGGRGGRGGQQASGKPGAMVSTNEVQQYADESLYDPSVLRTLFFEFENADWESELEAFRYSDVDVPATLTVDGRQYSNVGIRFRGQSSYFSIATGLKRSFNISMNLADEDQRLYGYKTLNLLNSNGDPSYMSTVLYSKIANQYIPAPKANHVRVVINGRDWGIYVNVQQFNKDFLAEHFESTKGTRWKADGNPNADAGLRYLGDEIEPYEERLDMKSNDGKKAWKSLVLLCKTLNETPLAELETALEPMLDVDATLRFLALDVALVNSDGYWTRASDYSLFLDHQKRFHIIPHDMNEAFASGGHGPGGRGGPGGFGPPGMGFGGVLSGMFGPPPGGEFGPPEDRQRGTRPVEADDRQRRNRPAEADDRQDERGGQERGAGGGRDDRGTRGGRGGGRGPGGQGGGPGGRGGPGHGGVDLDPLVSIDNDRFPLRSRLLAVPSLREKYLGYIREIADQSMDWEKVTKGVQQSANLIDEVVKGDTRKLDTYEAFQAATRNIAPSEKTGESSLQSFFMQRRDFLLKYQP
ncbi:MAG: CotH kinase family protein [Pirellulaceae bacterium]